MQSRRITAKLVASRQLTTTSSPPSSSTQHVDPAANNVQGGTVRAYCTKISPFYHFRYTQLTLTARERHKPESQANPDTWFRLSVPRRRWSVKLTTCYIFCLHVAEFVHFCWRPRDKSLDESELDLIMIPGDGSFLPYTGKESVEDSENVKSPTDGRIFVLKFNSSSQRYLFWLQSKSQHPRGDASWFSERDLKIGQIVDLLLNGEEIDVHAELSAVQNPAGGDEDETMEDVEGTDHSSSRNRHGSTGGAGAGATGGDIREEGSESREGGADGGRA